jgi:hypothetical protein
VVTDLSGRTLSNEIYVIGGGRQQITLPVRNLPAGVYLLTAERIGTSERAVKKFIK